MNNFDWLVQEFFTKSAAEDKKEKDDEKKESPKHEAMEKKEDKKEKKASRLELYLDKSAGVDKVAQAANKKLFAKANGKIADSFIQGPKPHGYTGAQKEVDALTNIVKSKLKDPEQYNTLNVLGLDRPKKASTVHETAEALDGLADVIVAHPGKAALVAGIGLPVLYGLGQGMNIGLGALSHHIGKDMHKDNFAVKHPYLTDLAGIPANAILPGAALATETAARAGATRYADELASHKPHGGEGVLARYSMKNPHMGPFLSMFVPGTHSVNSTLAAKTIADRAIKDKSFTYRHPYMSAYGHGLIPGSGTAYAQAAARIQDYKDSL